MAIARSSSLHCLRSTIPQQWTLNLVLTLPMVGTIGLVAYLCYQDGQNWAVSVPLGGALVLGQIAIALLFKHIQEALNRSEANLVYTQEIARLCTWEFDLTTQCNTWSKACFQILGVNLASSNEPLANFIQLIPHEEQDTITSAIQRMANDGTPYEIEHRILRPDGDLRHVINQGKTLLNERQQPIKLYGTILDITERKQAEAILQEREAMLRAIGDNLPKGFIYQRVYEPGKGSFYSYVSAGVERLLGLTPEAILADPTITRTVGFKEDLALADQVAQESLQHLTPIELQMRHRTPAGGIGWSSIRSTPRRLVDGRTIWEGIEVDITDLKLTEAALRESEELFRRAFDDAPIGISLVSPTGRFLKINSCYCNLLGYTETELLSLKFQDITHPEDLEADVEGLRAMFSGEIRSFQIEKRYITKQGNVVPVLVNAALVRDQDGIPIYSVGHIQDLRDRLKVERMKDEFISVISHELRTPLTSIQGALDILGSGVYNNRPEKARRMLEIAISNSERLERMVNDILNLERLISGKVQLVMEPCQVSDLMQQAVESVQTIAEQSGIALSWAPLQETLWADPDAVVQTLTNLLGNAIKFSTSGDTVWLIAEVHGNLARDEAIRHPLTAPYVLFLVKDQGRGIPEDKLDSIFEQFQQVDVSDSRKKGGTGLGLAICKNNVQQHQGSIWVESTLGRGSTFYVALPLNNLQVESQALPAKNLGTHLDRVYPSRTRND